jgi:hypothetical protein
MPDADRLAAWDRVHAALERLPGWRVSPPQLHPEGRRWHATAYDGRHHGRGRVHEAMEGVGATETEAIEDLARQQGEGGMAG